MSLHNKMMLGELTIGDVLNSVGKFDQVEMVFTHDTRPIEAANKNPSGEYTTKGRISCKFDSEPTYDGSPRAFVLDGKFFFTPAGLDPYVFSLAEKVRVVEDGIELAKPMEWAYSTKFRLFDETDPESVGSWGKVPNQDPILVSERLFGSEQP